MISSQKVNLNIDTSKRLIADGDNELEVDMEFLDIDYNKQDQMVKMDGGNKKTCENSLKRNRYCQISPSEDVGFTKRVNKAPDYLDEYETMADEHYDDDEDDNEDDNEDMEMMEDEENAQDLSECNLYTLDELGIYKT